MAATGEVDFDHAIAVLRYEGRKFYRYESQPLEDGEYLFAVRAESKAGVEGPLGQSKFRASDLGTAGGLDVFGASAV